jgi:hypothetical protein
MFSEPLLELRSYTFEQLIEVSRKEKFASPVEGEGCGGNDDGRGDGGMDTEIEEGHDTALDHKCKSRASLSLSRILTLSIKLFYYRLVDRMLYVVVEDFNVAARGGPRVHLGKCDHVRSHILHEKSLAIGSKQHHLFNVHSITIETPIFSSLL